MESPPGVPGVWLLLTTIVSTMGAIASTAITLWHGHGKAPTHDDISEAVEDAIDEYRRTFTEPLREENKRLRRELADRDRKRRPT